MPLAQQAHAVTRSGERSGQAVSIRESSVPRSSRNCGRSAIIREQLRVRKVVIKSRTLETEREEEEPTKEKEMVRVVWKEPGESAYYVSQNDKRAKDLFAHE